uniref:Uncharacterized protein n=1 Tax=Arundo donax TaxID=35708 RepID=A0A0A9B0Y1_ARUDO
MWWKYLCFGDFIFRIAAKGFLLNRNKFLSGQSNY